MYTLPTCCSRLPIATSDCCENEEDLKESVRSCLEVFEKLMRLINSYPTYYRPFGATSDIGGGTMYPPISYACSTCAIVMKL